MAEFEFLRVLRGSFFASFAVKGSCSWANSKDFDRKDRQGEAAKFAKEFKLSITWRFGKIWNLNSRDRTHGSPTRGDSDVRWNIEKLCFLLKRLDTRRLPTAQRSRFRRGQEPSTMRRAYSKFRRSLNWAS